MTHQPNSPTPFHLQSLTPLRSRAGLVVCLLGLLVPVAACDAEEPQAEDGDELRNYSDGTQPAGALQTLSANSYMNPEACSDGVPRYAASSVSHELVGVALNGPKSIQFLTFGGDLSITLHSLAQGKVKAKVTLTDIDDPNTFKICASPGTCTASSGEGFGPNVQMDVIDVVNDNKSAYADYSTTYTKACDPLAGRYCGQECRLHDSKVTFGQNGHTESNTFQGDVKLFEVSGGDLATIQFTSTKPMSSTPSLRVHALDGNNNDVRLGGKYMCTSNGMVGNKYRYQCHIPFDDAVASTNGYTDAHLKLSSSRTQAGAILEIWGASRNGLADYTCDG